MAARQPGLSDLMTEQLQMYARDVARLQATHGTLTQRLAGSRSARPRILLVDDEPGLRALVGETLGDTYDVAEAGSGSEALEYLRDAPPDLVILDVHLPDVTGIEICANLKDDEWLRHIPVVLLTAADQESEQEAGLAAGASYYLTKPFSPLRLVDVVRRLLPH